MTYTELPPLSAIDTKQKFLLWLATDEVIEQGRYDYEDFYDLLLNHFTLAIAKWRENK